MRKGGMFLKRLGIWCLIFSFVMPVPGSMVPKGASASDSSSNRFLSSEVVSEVESAKEDFWVEKDLMEGTKRFNIGSSSAQGAFIFDYPLDFPEGRNGMQPDSVLHYDSKDDNGQSPFGWGWSMAIPYVTRVNRTGVEDLYSNDVFVSSLSGDIFEVSSGSSRTYAPKTDDGDGMVYEFVNDAYWLAYDKMGKVYKFGAGVDSRLNDPNDASTTFKWMLEEVRDANGNYVKYDYVKDLGQIYPQNINYTGNGSTDGVFDIEFVLEDRVYSLPTSTDYGFKVVDKKRVKDLLVKVDDHWVRKYSFTYGDEDWDDNPILYKISELGRVEGEVSSSSLPDLKIQIGKHSENGWLAKASWDIPVSFDDQSNGPLAKGVKLGDVNGDRLVDIVEGSSVTSNHNVYINNGQGWSLDTSYSFDFNLDGECSFFGDINGDGLADALYAKEGDARAVYVNRGDGTGWDEDQGYDIPMDLCADDGSYDGAYVFDVNGDELPDLLKSNASTSKVYLNGGGDSGWQEYAGWTLPEPFHTNQCVVGRFDGDSLADIICSNFDYTYAKFYSNKGDASGWEENHTYPTSTLPAIGTEYGVRSSGIFVVDINNDELDDIVGGNEYNSGLYLNSNNESRGFYLDGSFYLNYYLTENRAIFGDINGDGMTDMLYSEDSGPSDVYINKEKKAGIVKELQMGGSKILLSYEGESHLGFPALSEKVLVDSSGERDVFVYEYSGGILNSGFAVPTFSGFKKLKTIDPRGGFSVEYYHQGDTSSSTLGEYQDSQYKIGLPYRMERYDSSGNLYTKTIRKWEDFDLGNARKMVKMTASTDLSYDGDNDHRDKATSFVYETSFGNLISKIDFGEVSASDDGSFTDIGSDSASTSFSYAVDPNGYVMGLPATERVEGYDGSKLKEVRYYYDDQSLGQVSAGNMTKREDWVEGGSYIDIEKDYDGRGLVIEEKDGRDKTTAYVYDQHGVFVSSSTDALGQTTEYERDYSSGKVVAKVDHYGNVWTTVLDAFDRPLQELAPVVSDDSPGQILVTQYAYYDNSLPRKISQVEHFWSQNPKTTENVVYFDEFGSVIQERLGSGINDRYAVRDYEYSYDGLLLAVTKRYYGLWVTRHEPSNLEDVWSRYDYDTLGRLKKVSDSLGSTTYAYDDWKTTEISDVKGTKDLHYDAFGRLVKVGEHYGAAVQETEYLYDGLGRTIGVVDAQDNERAMVYDGMNRLIKEEDLHSSVDTIFASTTYSYDDSGNIAVKTGEDGAYVTYSYDDLNRLTSEDFGGQSGVEVRYGYDGCDNGFDRPCHATTSSALVDYEYNNRGLLKSVTKKIKGVDYTTTYGYQVSDDVTSVTDDGGAVISYYYEIPGLVRGLTWREAGGQDVEIIKEAAYNPNNDLIYLEHDNDVKTFLSYDEAKKDRLTSVNTIGEASFGSLAMGIQGDSLPEPQALVAKGMASLASDGSIKLYEPIELSDESSDLAKVSLIGYTSSGKRLKKLESRSIADFNGDSKARDSKAIMSDEGSYFKIEKGDKASKIYKNLTGGMAEFSVRGHSVKLASPTSYKSGVSAEMSVDSLRYKDAMGKGLSLEVSAGDRLSKVVSIDSYESIAKMGKDGYLELPFSLTVDEEFDLRIDGKLLSQEKVITSSAAADIVLKGSDGDRFRVLPPLAEFRKASSTVSKVDIAIRYEWGEKGVKMTKLVPMKWLSEAEYPVKTDAVVEYYSLVGDGYVYNGGSSDWASVRNATSGTAVYDESSFFVGVSLSENGDWSISRSFLAFDTSVLTGNAVIASATVRLHCDNIGNENISDIGYISLYQASQESTSSLSSGDFDEFEGNEVNTPDSKMRLGEFQGGDQDLWHDFVIAAGNHYLIDGDGYTKFALLIGYDALDNNEYITQSSSIGALFSSHESDYDPTLEIVYTEIDDEPFYPVAPLIDGRPSPTRTVDATPEFSAIFYDGDDYDTATHYQLQVGTDVTFSNGVVWDTGMIGFASGTEISVGERCPDIVYSGPALSYDQRYYWRMRLYDDNGTEGGFMPQPGIFVLSEYDDIQDVQLEYGEDGLVSTTTDSSDTDTAKETSFLYDYFGRMEHSTTTGAVFGGNYYYDRSYDELGNPLSEIRRSDNPTWYDGSWGYRKKVTIDNLNVDDDLYGYPVYLDLSSFGSDFFSKVKSGGGDIRVTKSDKVTELPREVVSCNTASSTGELYFKADAISSTTDNEFYVYYGNSAAQDYATSSAYGAGSVWSAYRFVSHDSGKTDSTGNFHASTTATTASTTCKFGTCYYFNGSTNYAKLGTDSQVFGQNPATWNVSAWVNLKDKNEYHSIVNSYSSSGSDSNYAVNMVFDDRSTNDDFGMESRSNNVSTNYGWSNGTGIIGNWHQTHITYNKNGYARFYFDGIQRVYTTSKSTGDYTDGGDVYIGTYKYRNRLYYFLKGSADEIRISTTTEFSAAWVDADYQSQNNPSSFSVSAAKEDYAFPEVKVYLYEGDSGSSLADPQAATEIASSSYSYDAYGNLLSDGKWTHTWDWRGNLIESSDGTSTVRYAYDETGWRVAYFEGSATTTSPDRYRDIRGATTTRNIYLGDLLVAVVVADGYSTTTYHIHSNHDGSVAAVTDSSGSLYQLLDYNPNGTVRIDQYYGRFDVEYGLRGGRYDHATGLVLTDKGYYSPRIGRYLQRLSELTLEDPQSSNLYGSHSFGNVLGL